MPVTIQTRRLTSAARGAVTPALGEPVWDTTTSRLFWGDGATLGGVAVNPDASDTVKGIVEKATDAEVRTGTDTDRFITPNQYRLGMLYGGTKVAHVDGVNGSDANGAVNRFDRPYQTINAALTAVGTSGVVVVRPTGNSPYAGFTTTAADQSLIFDLGVSITSPIVISHAGASINGGVVADGITVSNASSITCRDVFFTGISAEPLSVTGTGVATLYSCTLLCSGGSGYVAASLGAAASRIRARDCSFIADTGGGATESISAAAPATITLVNCTANVALGAGITNNGTAIVVDADIDF